MMDGFWFWLWRPIAETAGVALLLLALFGVWLVVSVLAHLVWVLCRRRGSR